MSIHIKSGSANTYLKSILEQHTTSYQKSMDQLSSGNKYNSVGDNPIAVCTSAKLDVKISANNQAVSNVKVGGDMLTMVEDSQENVISNLERIRDLCVQAATGTYTAENKDYLLKEIRARLDYINSTADLTKFNNINLMDGTGSSIFLQIGISSDATMDVGDALIDVHPEALKVDLKDTVTGETWTTDDIKKYMDKIDNAVDTLLASSAKLGGYLNRLDFVSGTLTVMGDNLVENKSLISDTDMAESSADMVKYQILQEASASILTQANQVPSWALQLLKR